MSLLVVVVMTVSVAKVRVEVLRLLLPPLMKAEKGRRRV